MKELDGIDCKILQELIQNGRVSFSKIAKKIKLTDVAVKKRVERLLLRGVIEGFSLNLNYNSIGFQNILFFSLRAEQGKLNDVLKRIKETEGIIEVYEVLGEFNLLSKAICIDLDAVQKLVKQLSKIDGLLDMKSFFVLKQEKKANSLPSNIIQKKLN